MSDDKYNPRKAMSEEQQAQRGGVLGRMIDEAKPDDLCQCPKCGRMHKNMGFGTPPASIAGPAADPAPGDQVAEGRLATVHHVQQKHHYGCVVACLAMVSGLPYDDVAALYPWMDNERGLNLDTVAFDFLWRQGFAMQIVYPRRPGPPFRADGEKSRRERSRDPWPPAPWAEAHLCQVNIPGGSHCVVMLADGAVLDPMTPECKRLADYERVHNVRGLFDIRAPAHPAQQGETK